MRKRILPLLLALMMVLQLCPMTASAADTGEPEYITTADELVELLRQAVTDRVPELTVYMRTDRDINIFDECANMLLEPYEGKVLYHAFITYGSYFRQTEIPGGYEYIYTYEFQYRDIDFDRYATTEAEAMNRLLAAVLAREKTFELYYYTKDRQMEEEDCKDLWERFCNSPEGEALSGLLSSVFYRSDIAIPYGDGVYNTIRFYLEYNGVISTMEDAINALRAVVATRESEVFIDYYTDGKPLTNADCEKLVEQLKEPYKGSVLYDTLADYSCAVVHTESTENGLKNVLRFRFTYIPLQDTTPDTNHYVSVDEAMSGLPAMAESRQNRVILYLHTDEVPTEDSLQTLLAQYINKHTGVPTQGDYLRNMWSAYNFEIKSKPADQGYNSVVSFSLQYVTTAAQEAYATEQVRSIVDSFGFTPQTSDYDKIYTIYSYIAANYSYAQNYNPHYNSAYALLTYGTSDVLGPPQLLHRLALQAGLDSRIVVCTDANRGYYNINLIGVDGVYYYLSPINDLGSDKFGWFLVSPYYAFGNVLTPEFHNLDLPFAESHYNPPPTDHKHQQWVQPTREATCQSEGRTFAQGCWICGFMDRLTEIVPKKEHIYELTNEERSGCYNGIKLTYTCTECGDTKEESLYEQIHTDADGDFTCDNCRFQCNSYHYDTVTEDKAPTCTSAGFHGREYCTECYTIFNYGETLSPIGHDYTLTASVPATCTVAGKETYVCKHDSSHVYTTVTDSLGHSSDTDKDGLCDTCGLYFMCSHDLITDTPAINPTCTEVGYAGISICLKCGFKTDNVELEPLGHDFVDGICRNCGASRFVDVAEGDFFYDPVLWALVEEITTGTSENTFSPENPCTRDQVVTFLWRAMGKPVAENRSNPFVDVKEGDYFYEAVLWAVENGITTGTSATTFSPTQPCTFLWRTMGKPETDSENVFEDLEAGVYYYAPVLWAKDNAITTGTSATTFSPDAICTRGQIVTFLYRCLSKK